MSWDDMPEPVREAIIVEADRVGAVSAGFILAALEAHASKQIEQPTASYDGDET